MSGQRACAAIAVPPIGRDWAPWQLVVFDQIGHRFADPPADGQFESRLHLPKTPVKVYRKHSLSDRIGRWLTNLSELPLRTFDTFQPAFKGAFPFEALDRGGSGTAKHVCEALTQSCRMSLRHWRLGLA